MEFFYNDIVNFFNSIGCSFLSAFSTVSVSSLDSQSLNNIYFVLSWLAFFHNPNIFPSVFILGFDAFIATRAAFAFVSFVRWVSGLFQNAKVW